MRDTLMFLLVAGALSACRADRASSESLQLETLSEALTIREKRQGSDATHAPFGTLIDYDSKIFVQPDPIKLAALAGSGAGLEAAQELEHVQAQTAAIKTTMVSLLRDIADYEKAYGEFWDRGAEKGMPIDKDPLWRALGRKQLALARSLNKLAWTRIQIDHFGDRAWSSAPEAQLAEHAGMLDALYALDALPDDPEAEGAPARTLLSFDSFGAAFDEVVKKHSDVYRTLLKSGSYDADEVTLLVNGLTDAFKQRLEQLEARARHNAAEAQFEMEASLVRDGERIPISITPYAIVEGIERGNKSPRAGIPSKQDAARVQREYEAYGEVSKEINQLKSSLADPAQLAALKQELVASLEDFVTKFKVQLRDKLRALGADLGLASIKADIESLESALETLFQETEDLIRDAKSLELVPLAARAAGLYEQGLTIQANLKTLVDALKVLADDTTVEQAAKKLYSEALALFEASAKAEFAKLDDSAVGGLFRTLKKLADMPRLASFADLKPGALTRRPFDALAAPTGVVDLANTPAEQGDVLELRQKLSVRQKEDANPGVPPTPSLDYPSSTRLEIRKFGVYTTFRGQLIFFDRRGSASSFQAAPGINYNFHYRPDSSHWFHDVVAPGIGLSVSSPSFEDGTELAVGGQLTLFNDMLQVGYGYNISVDDDPQMFFFGLDLISAFQSF